MRFDPNTEPEEVIYKELRVSVCSDEVNLDFHFRTVLVTKLLYPMLYTAQWMAA